METGLADQIMLENEFYQELAHLREKNKADLQDITGKYLNPCQLTETEVRGAMAEVLTEKQSPVSIIANHKTPKERLEAELIFELTLLNKKAGMADDKLLEKYKDAGLPGDAILTILDEQIDKEITRLIKPFTKYWGDSIAFLGQNP